MADDKKNQEALEALHRLQDAQAATSTVTKTDWKAASQSADSFIETANATAASVRQEYTKNVDSNYINSFLKDSRLHMNNAVSDKKRMGVTTSKSIYESRKKTYGDLHKRSYEISRYLEDNKDKIDEETYRSLKDYLDAFDKTSSQSIHSFYRNQKFYSQFKTQEDYDKYITEKEAYEAKVNLDLDTAAKEIEDLQAKREDYAQNHEYDWTDFSQRDAYNKTLEEMDAQIAQKKQFMNQARHTQEGAKLSSVADPFSDSYDTDFRSLSKYSTTIQNDHAWWSNGTGDAQYEWINNQNGYRDSYESDMDALNSVANATTQSSFYVAPVESAYRKKGYDHLTKDEIAIYNYYYAKDGKEKAQEYLDSIQETLNYRKATEMYGELEDQTALELAFGVKAGLDQFASGISSFLNTEDDYIPQSAVQMTSGMVRQDLGDAGFKLPEWLGTSYDENGNPVRTSIAQAGYDLVTTSANMAPSILASTAISFLNPTAGKWVGNGLMGMSAAGNAYQQALNEGYDKNQARAYSTMIGASEAILGEMLGGISKLGGTSKAVTNMLNGVDNAFLRFIGKVGGSFISEGFEEGLQEVLSPMFSNFFLHTDEDINWSEVAYSALLGGFSALGLDGPVTAVGEVNTYSTGRQLQNAGVTVQQLSDIGNKFSADTVAHQLAGRVNENTGAYTMGRLFNEIGATMTEQNVNDITNALVKEGIPEKIAKNKANLMAKIVEGAELTEEGIRAIEADTLMSRVMKTTFVDSNSTWFQRSKGYNEVLKALAQEKVSRTNPAQQGEENAPASDKVDAENKNDTETAPEVDTSHSKVRSITTIKDGQVTLKMEDGSEVDITEADIDPDDGVRIETIAKIGGISANDANYILATLKATPGASAQIDALGAKEAYQYGFYGISDAHMAEHGVFVNTLSKAQRDAIYKTGREARAKQVAVKQEAISKKETTTNKVDNKMATADKKAGKVHFDGNHSKLTARQKASLTAMEKVAEIMGVQIHVFESKVGKNGKHIGANGWYDPRDNSIHIDLHAGANGEGTMLFTLSHELTHHIRKWSPEKFKILSDFLMEEYGKKGENVDALVRKQQEKAKKNRNEVLSYDAAWEEVVADSMETMLADGNVLNRLEKLKAKDKDLWHEIKRFINDLADKIRAVYKGLTPDSEEGRIVADMGKAVYRLQELFADALMDASENYQMAEKNTTEDGGVDHEAAVKRSDRIVDQIRSSLADIMALDIVYTIDSSNATPYTGIYKTDEESGKDVFKGQGGYANRPGFGRVVLGRKGAVSTVFHGNGPAKQAAFPAIKAVIEQGIEIGRDYNHNGKGFDTVTFAAPVNFFETKTPLGVVVKVSINGRGDKSFYIHEICDAEGNYIELADGVPTKKEISNTGLVDSSSTAGAADDGISPKTSIRNDSEKVNKESLEGMDITVDSGTESVAPAVLFSERTWTESDYVQERTKAAKEIAKAIGVSEKKARDYIDSVNSIAKMIAEDRVRLDYFSSPGRSSFVGNVEYGGSFDFSTLCKKRRLLTGTFTAIQKALPNTALTANEILDIRNRMKNAGLEVSCGLCYVEGSRANMGQFAKEFLKLYKQYYPDAWQPNMADVNTPDGIEWVRINHPECYEQYEYFWNHYGTMKPGDKNLFASQQKPKLYQLHTEYKGEILEKFNDDDNVEDKNLNGGIRLQSFSDFEIVHLIDTMQIIMDMSRVGLAGQAYTKVPDFAWALGDTGLKINLSLIAKGVDENGKLIFDDVEGMPIADAMRLRDRYSANVGTILVAFSDEQLMAAMADDRVDYIIPFHRSQWKKSQYGAMGLPAKTKDYTYMQNEKFIKPQYHEYRGRMVKDKATNYMPNEYWDFSKSGKENAIAYLEMCARNNKRPKFYKLLQNNGDGSYSLKADGSTDGYWKLLIDFKMYDNDGNGSPQMPVKPEFNMEEATRMLDTYSGGHSNFPVAQGIVDEFVKEYKDSHKGVLYSDRDTAPTFYSHMARVVDGVKQNKLGAASVVSMLRGKGVKAEEIKWSGIETFLEGKKSVTKAELQEFIAGSMLQIEEDLLTNEEMPYSQEHLDLIAKYEGERDTIAENLKSEWKRIVGTDIPITYFGAGLESVVVQNLLEANSAKKGETEAGYKYKAARAALQRCIEYSDDYFGFDNERQALREAVRNPKDFMNSYELTSFEKGVFRDFIKAKEAYSKVEGISMQDQKALKAIAESADRFSSRINKVKAEHRAKEAKRMTKYGAYTVRGGTNYRELLFRMPGATYSNRSMDIHWDRSGVLAHARIQDLDTFLGKMLFIEEIQSDWHNEGHKTNYQGVPDAPFRDTYHEYVLKRLIRMAAEQGYDSIGWTTADIQSKRWSDEFAEGYRIEYDQDIPKFLNKYGKKWGTKVGKTVLDNGTEVWSMAITDSMQESVLTEGQPLYSERDPDSVSNRSLLANALESVAKNDSERRKIQEYKEKIGLINAEEKKLRELNRQLKAESDPKRMREIQFDAQQTANRINTYDRQLLRLEASRPLQDVLTREKKMAFDRGVQRGKDALEAYRERAEKKQQETIERYQESRKRGVENRQKTAMRQKIRKTIRDLDKILNRGDKKRNVKEGMKDFVADALTSAEILFTDSYSNEDMVRNGVTTELTPEETKLMNEARAIMDEIANLPTGYEGWQARQEQEQKLKGRLAYRMAKMKDVFIRERARINKTQVSEVLGNLADSYARLETSEYAHVQGAYQEAVHEYLKMLQEDVGGTIIKDMTLGQLEELYKAYTMVMTTVRKANLMFADNLNNTREALANRVMFEVHEAGGEHGLWSKAGDKLNSFSWNNEKPVYAFERIGSKTLKTLYGNIRKGQDGWAVDIQEANDFRMNLYKKYKHNTWDVLKQYKFTSSSGIDFQLNIDQIMSLYAYSKRAQAHDHLLKGGFVFDGNTEVVVNKKGFKMTFLNKTATAYNLSFEILENIISKLTPEQKAFVDEMQEYLSTTMGEKGNQVSMELYGVKLFNEKFYFPLRSAGQYMEKAKEADMKQKQGQVNLANSGFSKAVKIKASNPVVLTGFMDVWAGHVNEMSMYHSFVLPMEDFRRVYNYSSPHMEGRQSATVNGVIQNAYGAAATDYIDQLYRDLNGGALTDSRTGPINKLMNLFKKGAVFASASVTVQQPSAIARATALVDIKHFIGPKVDAKRHEALWEEVKQYAPVAVIKEMGFFDTNMGRSATDFLTAEEYSGIKGKALALVKDESYRDEMLSKAPALADELTWCAIWEAVKRETKAKHPGMNVKSEEFLKLAGDRFSEVIDKTQVYDSVLARSANMRSKDTGMKMATAFMAEPTTSINMVADALRKGKKGNKKQAARIIGSVVSSVILNSFLVAWVYAARDDDEDETFREKYISSFLSGIIDGVNPMTYIPFLKDIVSIMQGYDVERSDMAVISDLWNAWKQLGKDDVSAWRKVEGFVGSICQIFGLPVKNIMRDVRSVFQAYDTIVHGEKNTIRGTAIAIVEGITGQKPSNPEQLYKARKAGDEAHAARVEARYDDEDSANAAVRKAITDRYMDDKLTLAQATMQLTQYAGMKTDEAYWLMRGWKYKKETGSDDYNKYNDFYEAVQTGKNLKAVIKEYTDNGVKTSTLSGQITSHFKDEYVQMSAGERANIKGYLINAFEQCGVSRENAEERLREWDFEAKYGGSYEEIVAEYKNGDISEATMRNILADKGYGKSDIEDKIHDWNTYKLYGYEYSKLDDAYRAGEISREEFRQAMIDNGTFPAKADQAIVTYDWMRDNAQYGLEYSDAGKYAHPIENYGHSLSDVNLDPDIYLEYKELKKECQGIDADNDGKADSGTLRAAKFEMIDSLPINNDQKDALAAIDYSMKSIRRYAPWH